jgi:hypothetical protein
MSVATDIHEVPECSLEYAPIVTGNRGGSGFPDQKPNGFGLATIAAGQRCDKENATMKAAEPDRNQSPRKPVTIFRLAAMLPMSGTFERGETRIEVSKALSLLQLTDSERESARLTLTNNKQQLDDKEAVVESVLRNLQKEHEASITKNKTGPGLLASLLYEKYWPYILIAALGMKIARVRYLTSDRNEAA